MQIVSTRPFKFTLKKLNYAAARQYCINNYRGDLSSASTESRWSSLKSIVDNIKTSGKTTGKLWVGIWKAASIFEWVDVHKSVAIDSKRWGSGQPSTSHRCAVIRIADYLLESVSCSEDTIDGIICEETPSSGKLLLVSCKFTGSGNKCLLCTSDLSVYSLVT